MDGASTESEHTGTDLVIKTQLHDFTHLKKTHKHTHTYKHTYTRTHTHIHTQTHTHINTSTQTHTHTQTHKHTHTHTHTNTHTGSLLRLLLSRKGQYCIRLHYKSQQHCKSHTYRNFIQLGSTRSIPDQCASTPHTLTHFKVVLSSSKAAGIH